MTTLTNIQCPACSHSFSAESAIQNEIKAKLENELKKQQELQAKQFQQKIQELQQEKENFEKLRSEQEAQLQKTLLEKEKALEQAIKKRAADHYKEEIEKLKKDLETNEESLKKFRQMEIRLLEKEKELRTQKEEAELQFARKIAEREEVIRKEIEKVALEKAMISLADKERDLKKQKEEMDMEIMRKMKITEEKIRQEEDMKIRELQKQLDDQKKLAEEMRKKAEQGSMQLQGEVQELALEEMLRISFPHDVIEEVGKGVKGADCIQVVNGNFGKPAGKIIYESKRTKNFSNDWIGKLKEDMRQKQCDIAVIVTEALPKDMLRFGQVDGIWICTFSEVKSLAFVFRDSLLKIMQATSAQENKGDKMQMLYNYLTGNEFKQQIEAIVEAFSSMQEDLNKEMKLYKKLWAEREKQITKVMESTLSMYGSVRGIAGGAIEIKSLEMNGLFMLEEPEKEDKKKEKDRQEKEDDSPLFS